MQIFYLKLNAKIETDRRSVTLGDVAQVLCGDERVQQRALEIVVYDFSDKKEAGVQRTVIDVMQIIALLQAHLSDCIVKNIGESAAVVELHRIKPHPVLEKCKIGLIALLCFFGAAFTIMAFHNDISIEDIFARVYLLTTGMESDGFTVLEISYSIGLSVGIILFFNHIGTRRITKDPTPIEVQMRQYEGDVVTAIVENADRESGAGGNAEGSGADRESGNAEGSGVGRESGNAEGSGAGKGGGA